MAIQVEMWQPVIKEQLFATNQFANFFRNADEYVIGGRVVHIPQSGGPSGVVRNRTTLPATIVKRTDTDIVYALDEFTTNPTLIPHAEKVELSYNKMQSVIRENTAELMQLVGDWLLYKALENAVAGNRIATTGANAGASAPSATGDRKILTEADIRKAKTAMDNDNVPRDRRYLLLSPDMIDHLYQDKDLKYAFQNVADLESGVVARLYGFNILERSHVATVNNSQVAKAPGAATATTDSDAALFWQQDFLERSMGDVTMFDEYGRPEYYGDIFSFLVRMSGRACRVDNKGYGLIYRDTAA